MRNLGHDVFTFTFIKRFWDVIDKDIYFAMKFFEEHFTFNPGSNASFITLIPKSKDLLNLEDHRFINLIGCISTIISNVFVEREKAFNTLNWNPSR